MAKKFVEFGKDLALMAQVMQRGCSVGIGKWEFWCPLNTSKTLMAAAASFLDRASPERIAQLAVERAPWVVYEPQPPHIVPEPDVQTLADVVHKARWFNIGKREWQSLAENIELFKSLHEYLRLAPPFSIDVEVDYDADPPYKDGLMPLFAKSTRKGVSTRSMSIYPVRFDTQDLYAVEAYVRERGWSFANQNELYAFGQRTKESIRPWQLIGDVPIFGPGTRKEKDGYISFPRLWMLRGNECLDLGGCCVPSRGADGFRRIVIVKND